MCTGECVFDKNQQRLKDREGLSWKTSRDREQGGAEHKRQAHLSNQS